MKILRKIIKISAIIIIAIAIAITVMFFIVLEPKIQIADWEKLDDTKLTHAERTVTLVDDEENILTDCMYDINKTFTPIETVSQKTIDAFVSIEDRRFYSHHGVDYLRILSAVKTNIKSGSFKEGASTISQQLIKNTHLSGEKSISRKLKEIRIARDLERRYSKNEIMEMYLNILYFGNNIYGIGSAAKIMFGKEVSDLSVAQSALLAGIINNPTAYSPYKNPENALKRRNLVLKQMLKNNKITREDYDASVIEPLNVNNIPDLNSQYINCVFKQAGELLHCEEKDLFRRKLTIGTNVDCKMQNALSVLSKSQNLPENALLQILVMNNLSGNIISVCGNNEINFSEIKRQPGSTIKPILSYAPALEKNLIVPITPILDEKIKFGNYSPSNYNAKYLGWTTAQNSLINSSNVCAVKLLDMTGIKTAKSYAEKCGVTFSKNDKSLALALGGMTEGLTLRQIANTYQVFANGGNFIESSYIRYIKDENGKYLYRRKITEKHVFGSETAFFINSMLSECAKSGTARKLKNISRVCAKTGTVGDKNGNTDAYCIAYTPDYTVAVWIGSKNSDNRHQINGGGLPAEIAKNVLDKYVKTYGADFYKPSTVIETEIDSDELIHNHKIVAATEETPLKFRKKAYFTKATIPQSRTSLNINSAHNDYASVEPDNFEII